SLSSPLFPYTTLFRSYGVWVVYMSHFFTVWVVAAVIWHVARPRFGRYALMTVLVTVGAFLTYWLYPAQPPWLAGNEGLIAPVDRSEEHTSELQSPDHL